MLTARLRGSKSPSERDRPSVDSGFDGLPRHSHVWLHLSKAVHGERRNQLEADLTQSGHL